MKKIKTIAIALLILALTGGFVRQSIVRTRKTEESQFLFDTLCTITVYQRGAKDAVDQAFSELSRLHKLTDFFDEGSDVSKINKAAANQEIQVAPEVIEIIEAAQEVYRASDGAFDITVAPLSMLWKFDTETPAPPEKAQITQALSRVGGENLKINKETMTVTKLQEDIQIDLGGAAKGYAGDLAVKVLKDCGIESGIVDLGGNITCFGKNPNTKNGTWRIGLQTPFAPTGDFETSVEVEGGAVVTSGTYQRYFEHNGKKYHHIIDPKTGYPANKEYSSVTVKAENTLMADCLATAIFVAGREKGEKLAEEFGAEVYFK